MSAPDLHALITVAGGQVSTSGAALGSGPITTVLTSYLGKDALVIAGATITSQPGDAHVIVHGAVTLLGVTVTGDARFFLDGEVAQLTAGVVETDAAGAGHEHPRQLRVRQKRLGAAGRLAIGGHCLPGGCRHVDGILVPQQTGIVGRAGQARIDQGRSLASHPPIGGRHAGHRRTRSGRSPSVAAHEILRRNGVRRRRGGVDDLQMIGTPTGNEQCPVQIENRPRVTGSLRRRHLLHACLHRRFPADRRHRMQSVAKTSECGARFLGQLDFGDVDEVLGIGTDEPLLDRTVVDQRPGGGLEFCDDF